MGVVAKDESLLLSEIHEAFDALSGIQRSADIAYWIDKRHPGKWILGTVGSYLRRSSVNMPGAIKKYPGFDRFLFCRRRGQFELYDLEKHGVWDVHGSSNDGELENEEEQLPSSITDHPIIGYESNLRDSLAKQIGLLEHGLTLWTGDVTTSVEYWVGGGSIDILAKDASGLPVIVELKLKKGDGKALGQALDYRTKLRKILNVTRVRIIIAAAKITEELKAACEEVQDVDVFSCQLTLKVEKLGA